MQRQDALDVKLQLQWIAQGGVAAEQADPEVARQRTITRWILATAVLGWLLALAGVLALLLHEHARQVVRALTHPKSHRKHVPNPLVLHGPPGSGKSMLVQTLIRKLTDSPLGLSAQALPAKEIPRSTTTQKDSEYEIKDLQRMDFLALEDVHLLPTRFFLVPMR